MANHDLDATFGFVDVRQSVSVAGNANANNAGYPGANQLVEANNYETVQSMRTRLTALDATTYTSTYLNMMSKNDMVYALRLKSDTAGVK